MTNYRKQGIKFSPLLIAAFMLLASVPWLAAVKPVSAAPFQQAFVRLDVMRAVTATGGRVCAEPATAATEASVQVTFPTTAATDYVVNATVANWTVTTTGLDAGQTAWPGIGTATAVSGKTVTFPSGELTVGTLYCFNFSGTNTLTTSSAGVAVSTYGNILTRTVAPADIDKTTYDIDIISDDRITISAVVPPIFTFALSGNTDSFTSDLSLTSIVPTNGRTVTISTNAPSGWIVWVRDLNDNGSGRGSLRSATAGNYNIDGTAAPGTTRTLSNGVEDYGLGVTTTTDATGGGTVSLDAAYNGAGSAVGTLDPTQFRPVATSNGTASGTGDVINLVARAGISGDTPAGSDYTDTLTVIGAGRF